MNQLNWTAGPIRRNADDVFRDLCIRNKSHELVLPITQSRRADAVFDETEADLFRGEKDNGGLLAAAIAEGLV